MGQIFFHSDWILVSPHKNQPMLQVRTLRTLLRGVVPTISHVDNHAVAWKNNGVFQDYVLLGMRFITQLVG